MYRDSRNAKLAYTDLIPESTRVINRFLDLDENAKIIVSFSSIELYVVCNNTNYLSAQ